ncbi:hypothetical protein [Candidatus Hecatella orcuttiae]|uniref:hypothetical protein n=1 Tax=Candidatus Hecatella orcuttiae TaxID=1935119 RepID=UPI002867CE61|nr:hypothetical protein [Candidatus Hecatella orcuttiae]
MSKIWRSLPLHARVIESLKVSGPCTDEELLRNLRKDGDDTLSASTLNKALFQLEIRGLIHVSTAPRGRKKIELRKT